MLHPDPSSLPLIFAVTLMPADRTALVSFQIIFSLFTKQTRRDTPLFDHRAHVPTEPRLIFFSFCCALWFAVVATNKQGEGISPDVITTTILVKAQVSSGDVDAGARTLIEMMKASNLKDKLDAFPFNTIIKVGSTADLGNLFFARSPRDLLVICSDLPYRPSACLSLFVRDTCRVVCCSAVEHIENMPLFADDDDDASNRV